MQKRKVLLLNPPGERAYLRDYYCSKISKAARYCYPPTDLVILSGTLASRHRVSVIDAIASGLSPEECLKRIAELDIDTIMFLTSSPSWTGDFSFLEEVTRGQDITCIGIGDILMDKTYGAKILGETPWLDGVLLNFITDDILKFLEGDRENLNNFLYKENGHVSGKGIVLEKGEFHLPLPKHELFPLKSYYSPLARSHPFVVTIATYGCPFKCGFCIVGNVGYQVRNIDNLMEELRAIDAMGIREVLFKDGTFTASRRHVERLCSEMKREKLRLKWVCWTRIDRVDEELLSLMKSAGCHSVFFGVESGNDSILQMHKTGFSRERIKGAFRQCQRLGLRTMGTFILGLPGETEETIIDTIKFAKELGCDYASFNIATPRMGTDLREEAIEKEWISEDETLLDSSFSVSMEASSAVSGKKLAKLQKRANREFYLRPSYILKRILRIRSAGEMMGLVREGIFLIKNVFKRR